MSRTTISQLRPSGNGPTARPAPAVARSLWFAAPRAVEFRDETVAAPRAGEVRVRTLYSGISPGTEMLVYRGEVPRDLPLDATLPTQEGSFEFPIKYGYACVGRVVECGADVEALRAGDLVFAFHPHATEFTVPACYAVRLPQDLPAKRGVLLANVETAINALHDAAPRLGERVAVIGQGVVGLLIAQLARRAGASLVVTSDGLESRRALSMALGANFAVDPERESLSERLRDVCGAGADIVIEASGNPDALYEALRAAAFEGRVVIVSWYGTKRAPLELGAEFHRNRLTIRSSQVSHLNPRLQPRWTVERRRELAADYLRSLRLDELLTHTFAFANAAAAYELLDQRAEEAVQVVLEYDVGC